MENERGGLLFHNFALQPLPYKIMVNNQMVPVDHHVYIEE